MMKKLFSTLLIASSFSLFAQVIVPIGTEFSGTFSGDYNMSKCGIELTVSFDDNKGKPNFNLSHYCSGENLFKGSLDDNLLWWFEGDNVAKFKGNENQEFYYFGFFQDWEDDSLIDVVFFEDFENYSDESIKMVKTK